MNIVSYQMFMVVFITMRPSVHDIDRQKLEEIKGFKYIKSDISENSIFHGQTSTFSCFEYFQSFVGLTFNINQIFVVVSKFLLVCFLDYSLFADNEA